MNRSESVRANLQPTNKDILNSYKYLPGKAVELELLKTKALGKAWDY